MCHSSFCARHPLIEPPCYVLHQELSKAEAQDNALGIVPIALILFNNGPFTVSHFSCSIISSVVPRS